MALLGLEFFLLFFAGPSLFAYVRHRIPAIPALWAVTGYCLFVLLRDPGFDRGIFWNTGSFEHSAPWILGTFGVAAAIGIYLVRRYGEPGLFLNFPRTKPRVWAAVMLLYPVLSVYPQGVVYRAFIFHRYRELFQTDWSIVAASAAAFAYVHIVFRNKLAVGLTLMGGVLFGVRYLETHSLLVTSFEHALYGCFLFTVGVGRSLHYKPHHRRSVSRAPTGVA